MTEARRFALNRAQREFLLERFFEDEYDLLKVFGTCDREWLLRQRISVEDDGRGWPRVLMGGMVHTTLNNATYSDEYRELLALGEGD